MAQWKLDFDEIHLDERIGKGNFGEVYKGTYCGLDVAVKKLYFVDDDFMQKYIEREMDTLTGIHHPNIVQLMGLCIETNDMFIVTEYVSGGDLRSKLKDKSVEMDWNLITRLALDIALAMNYLHAKGLMHRDLKSHNLLVGENWKIKVCDFGLARKEEGGDFMTIVGTNEWMAPEVAMGEKYGKSADVFSYGMVLAELLSRDKPPERKLIKGYAFEKDDFEQLIPADTPPDLWDLLCDCAAFEPDERPTFAEIVSRLKNLSSNSSAKKSKKKRKGEDGKKEKKKHKGEDGKKEKKKHKSDDGKKEKKKHKEK